MTTKTSALFLPSYLYATLVIGLLLALQPLVQATQSRGANCIGCHSQSRDGMDLTGFTDTLDLGGSDGLLKLYQVEAGAVATVGITVKDTGGDLAISGFSRAGEIDSSELVYSPDSGWTSRSSGTYFTRNGNSQSSFALTVDPSTPADVYRLEMQIAGNNGGRWGERERFYVEVLPGVPVVPATVLVPTGSEWRYLDDGSDQGTAWSLPGFDDAAWSSGPAELGYGDGDEATEISFGPDSGQKYTTTYFRSSFQLSGAGAVEELRLRLIYDDGVAVYLNGTEVFRDNLAEGAGFQTEADAARGSGEEDVWSSFNILPSALLNGENLLAVEMHQSGPTSSDLSFNLELSAVVQPALLFTETGITYPTQAGKTYRFESSTDLKSWTAAGPATPGDGQPLRLDLSPGAGGNTFYRVSIE